MNDVAIKFKITETLDQSNEITRVHVQGHLAAYGAGYHNGFAFRLEGLNREDIAATTTLSYNGVEQAENGLESDSTEAIFIIAEDLKTKIPAGCMYYRTAQHCQEALSFEFELDIYFNADVDTSTLSAMPYNPFMFATPGAYVRDGLWYNPGRGLEVHLPDQAPTEKFDTYWYGWWSDSSDPATNRYFKTSDNLPWAILVPDDWHWPREHVDVVEVYSELAGYAESGGENNVDWYLLEKATEKQILQCRGVSIMIIHKYISVIAMTALLTACGGGDGETVTTGVTTDNSPQEEGTSSNSASMLVDTSGVSRTYPQRLVVRPHQ